MRTYILYNYFDCYRDECGLWSVNNQCIEADDLVIADDATDKDICEYLKQNGYLTTSDMRRLAVDDYGGDYIEILVKKTRCPIYGLMMNN